MTHLQGRMMNIAGRDGYHHHYRGRGKSWSSLLAAAALLGILGCADAIQLVPGGEKSGVVTYPVKGAAGAVTSPYRREALQTIEQYCQGPYTVVREGETRGRTQEARTGIGTEIVEQRRWGIQFRCQ